jgi:hypothetical protein
LRTLTAVVIAELALLPSQTDRMLQMDHVFHPAAFARAFALGLKEFTWASYLITKARVTDYWQLTNADLNSSKVATTAEAHALRQLASSRIPKDKKAKVLPFLVGESGQPEFQKSYRDLIRAMTYRDAIESASWVFKSACIREQVKSMQSPNRGHLFLRGQIFVHGDNGAFSFNITVVYCPETDSLIGNPILSDEILSLDTALAPAKKKAQPVTPISSELLRHRQARKTPKAPPVSDSKTHSSPTAPPTQSAEDKSPADGQPDENKEK